jgi:formylglycine-generating enzyme required for sulfatase activity
MVCLWAVILGYAAGTAVSGQESPAVEGVVEGVALDTIHTDHMGNTYVPVHGTHVLFCTTEVTLDDFKTFLRLTEKRSLESPHFEQGPDHPVVGVNYPDAQAYCRWLTGVERASGRIAPQQEYRMPNADEWSMAVGLVDATAKLSTLEQGLRSKTMYPWGETWPPIENAGNYAAQQIEQFDDAYEFTAPVGSFEPNRYGIHDLGGNVWEWCDSTGQTSAGQGILRGGSWVYFLKECLLASYEYRVPKQLKASSFGFRCVFDDRAVGAGEVREKTQMLAGSTEDGQARLLGERTKAPETPEEVEKRLAEQFEARKRFLMSNKSNEEEAGEVGDARARLLAKGGEAPLAGEGDAGVGSRERERPAGVEARPGEPFENSLGLKFIPVEGLPLLFGTTEVRVGDYEEFIRQNPELAMPSVSYRQGSEHPVVRVSWLEAGAFCEWLTKREREKGWIDETQEYRLPTDAEWSLMAGLTSEGGNSPSKRDGLDLRRFPWGDEWPPPRGVANIDALNLEGYFDPHAYTAEVGKLVPNGAGVFGLGGNVAEWCQDGWGPDSEEKVARGGSWMTSKRDAMLSSRRRKLMPDDTPVDVGFRCVLAFD